MITVILQGRLGNWLFQYAVGRALADRIGTDVLLDGQWARGGNADALLAHFGLRARVRPMSRLRERLGRLGAPRATFEERSRTFDPGVLDLPDGSRLRGWFQSTRYFLPMASVLRRELRPDPTRILGRDPVLEHECGSTRAVAVHVRRTDYLPHRRLNVCTPRYYDQARTLMRAQVPGAHFFVFSDDVPWCHAHLAAEDTTIPDAHAAPADVYDLFLMSLCRHHIIANSTFSFWAAWLAQSLPQVVMVPERWSHDDAENAAWMPELVSPLWQRVSI